MFNGRIYSWRTKITIGILLLLFIGLQRFIRSGEQKRLAGYPGFCLSKLQPNEHPRSEGANKFAVAF
jgi:hypothetical protein